MSFLSHFGCSVERTRQIHFLYINLRFKKFCFFDENALLSACKVQYLYIFIEVCMQSAHLNTPD